MIGIMASVTVI